MDFEQGLRTELQSITGLNKKVFPLTVPEGTKAPYIVYGKSSTEFIKSLDGNSTTRSAVYDIDIVSDTYAQLQSTFAALKTKVFSFSGRTIGTTSIYVQDVTVETLVELFEEEIRWHRMSLEIRFYFKEA